MNLSLYIFATLGLLLIGIWFIVKPPIQEKHTKYLLIFSGAFLFAIAINHLMPEIVQIDTKKASIYILIGFLFQLLLDFFSQGIEHGHIHHHSKTFPWGVFIGLALHALLEGMPFSIEHAGHSHAHHHASGLAANQTSFFVGILMHKLPIVIVLANLAVSSNLSKLKATLIVAAFVSMMPLGTLINEWATHSISNIYDEFHIAVLGIVSGIILHVSTVIMFETDKNHEFNIYKVILTVFAFVLAIVLF